ncbi:MAG: Low-specificity L-threonine aldolase, partial [Dehalococcoidia bacterium]|nr:Low-specificity L-threonine aldolase [Dehalococcoidia bacterium]
GTMANLVAMLTHCQRGDEIILGDESHTFYYESGGVSALGGVHPHLLPNDPQGRLDPRQVEAAIRPTYNIRFPTTRLICLENTHNRCSGAVLTPEYTESIVEIARRHGVMVHLDGARIFNAAVALEVEPVELARGVDSVTFCLSKGLACPVGSVLCGSAEFIKRARRTRQMVGGGMRQAGIVAAAGLYALEHMVDRLAEDHANARTLADGLAELPGLSIDPSMAQTNIVIFDLDAGIPAEPFIAVLRERGLLVSRYGDQRLRMVTHFGITEADVKEALRIMGEALREG